MISRVIQKDKPKEAIFKTLVQDYFLENPTTQEAVVTIGKSRRSDAQNRLYFAWVDILAKEIGYSKEEMHFVLADKFLTKIEFKTKSGKDISQIPSTRELNVDEFIDYICEIEMLSCEHGIKLPRTDDYRIAMKYENKST